MTAALLRLMTLFALVMMPMGMTGAPAAASAPSPTHQGMTGHCDEQPDQDQAPASKMDCTAMCTALPATDSAVTSSHVMPKGPRTITAATRFDGVILEIATPPPRQG